MRAIGSAVILMTCMLGACSNQPGELKVVNMVVRLNANPKAPSVAYFTIKGGAKDDRLMSVISPVVIRTELHESTTAGGMMSMKPLDGGVAVPAEGSVKFEPGGKHVMLFNLNPVVKPRNTIAMIFTFASGAQLQAQVPVRAAGDPLP